MTPTPREVPVREAPDLRTALDRTAAMIDDPARFIEVNRMYRAGWVDAVRAIRDDPAIAAADDAGLRSPVPPDPGTAATISEQSLGEALHHWRHPYHAGKPGWGICDCMVVARSIAADYLILEGVRATDDEGQRGS